MTRLMDWGQSMYGGYYATIVKEEKVIGLHAEKLNELREELRTHGLKAETSKRRDN